MRSDILIFKFEVDVGRLAFVVGVRMWWKLDEVRHVGEVAGLGRDGIGEGAPGGLPFSNLASRLAVKASVCFDSLLVKAYWVDVLADWSW
jgi:hypothetical protein